mgnify:FL=1
MTQQGLKDGKKDLAEQLDSDDIDALEDFCSGVDLDEIEFSQWCDHHNSLDLEFTLSVEANRAALGCTLSFEMSRSIKENQGDKLVCRREKVQHQIEIEPGTLDGHKKTLKGCGDCELGRNGNLHVTIRITKRK